MRDNLINNFLRICEIPRESGHEEKIADFFVNIAMQNHLYYFKDDNNNILIKKKGNRKTQSIALQAHLDMVCVKSENNKHDFSTDKIDVIIEENKVTANGTSLGADQGVGFAFMLSILEDKNLLHPDLEFIFTVEEETTFRGAVNFPYLKVESKRMINLDNDKDNTVFIGADGDICNEYIFKGSLIQNNLPSYRILIEGFQEGNSGTNIEVSASNAIVTMARLLNNKEIFIRRIDGGKSENDLATSCEVVLNTSLNINEIFKYCNAKIDSINNKKVFSKEDSQKIINQILELKSGHIRKKLSSANLGSICTKKNEVKIYYVFRSICEKELERINQETKALNNNFEVNEIYRDPIWETKLNSSLLKRYKEIYFNKYFNYPKEEICHGGMECAAIKKRIDGLDIISIGSTIENIHSTKETTYIDSWIKVYNLLIDLLKNIN